MPQFLESICLVDGQAPLLELHQQRVTDTFRHHFPSNKILDLATLIPPVSRPKTKQKVRIVYNGISSKVELSEYRQRPLKKLKLIEAPSDLDYGFKYTDRSELEDLFDLRADADEIIISKNDMVTDSFYANLAFWRNDEWVTPKSCLLNGVRRQHLLSTGQIKEINIEVTSLPDFDKVCLINAMLDLGDSEVSIQMID
ncbi:MAG: aminotransferase class IV [Marinoscillum sp.]